ncbi:PliI/PliC-like inhibitor of I-type lysozyme [Acinetobacter calcoaceticus]|uniref:PliI/PliC-like inhibitor of I-type lysozyme n=1 Tax=Acinetobacter calcoaceticus TaxID=471 RepID=A0A4R1XRX8_ACICA|nr:PliI/PliC-like inhibitor of I-type lysozyme [Acinetobacter calcoaceticus]
MKKIFASLILCASAIQVHAAEGQKFTLPDNRTAVISQGDLESASIGSYSIAIYKDAELMDLVAGAVFARDGSVFMDNGQPRIEFQDLNGDGNKELIVSKLTAGSGHYLEVDVLSLEGEQVKLIAQENGEKPAEILKKLKKKLTAKKI